MLCPAVAVAADANAAIDFGREVYPILERNCFDCHGSSRQEGDLRLDQRQAAFGGGSGGPPLVPGKPDESELLRRIGLPAGDEEIMPARGEPLSATEVATIRAWIAQGAKWPANFERPKHWAYVAPVRTESPAVKKRAWVRNPIDAFVLARLEQAGLEPSGEAERAILARRLSLDLLGLPPSPDEVDRFVADRGTGAYERLVDRLLASPHFGERWARPWLDLARYADSHGFQRDDLRELWPYRDWVIRALNRDLPFDQFTIEQLAGDLLPSCTSDQQIATGFHRATTINVEAGSDPEETRINQVIDRLNTTAYVWLGATLECAQCHDHKYDPFTQRDYYRLLAFFNNTQIEADRSNPKVPGSIRFIGPSMELADDRLLQERQQLETELAKIDKALAERKQALAQEQTAWESSLVTRSALAPQSEVLQITDFESAGGAGEKMLADGSVLLVDDPPDRDTYTIVAETKQREIRGLKLEVLTDPSLPGSGPGRGDAQRPNFVLSSFRVTAQPIEPSSPGQGKAVPVALVAGGASFEQDQYTVAAALDDNARSGWAIAPRFHQPHWAVFQTRQPIGFAGGTRLTFTLVQEFGAGRTIGRLRLSVLTGDMALPPVPADAVAILKKPAAKRTARDRDRLTALQIEQDPESGKLRERRLALEKKRGASKPPTTLVMRELEQPRAMHLFNRGDFRSPGDPVTPGVPNVLHPLPPGEANRLLLARWLVDRQNPVVARVTVNRWWAELFGRGLVTTPEDFGVRGERPTHPELLDWLAVEFMDHGWSMKHVLRTIVTSSTYRQSSKVSPRLLALDDQNRLYARGPRFRLDAETIRDNALSIAGLLSPAQFGPPIKPPQPEGLWTKVGGAKVEYVVSPGSERFRRGIYVVWKRGSPYPSFVNFDATARLACTVKRSRSNTPLQALTLLNDPVYVEAAAGLASRVLSQKADRPLDEQLGYAFRLCLAREPSKAELGVLRGLYSSTRASSERHPADAKALATQFAQSATKTAPSTLAAWYTVASALLNLDETITNH